MLKRTITSLCKRKTWDNAKTAHISKLTLHLESKSKNGYLQVIQQTSIIILSQEKRRHRFLVFIFSKGHLQINSQVSLNNGLFWQIPNYTDGNLISSSFKAAIKHVIKYLFLHSNCLKILLHFYSPRNRKVHSHWRN